MMKVADITGKNGLPAIYQELEYIENTGGQWIQTNVRVPTLGMKCYAKIMQTVRTSYAAVFGAKTSTDGCEYSGVLLTPSTYMNMVYSGRGVGATDNLPSDFLNTQYNIYYRGYRDTTNNRDIRECSVYKTTPEVWQGIIRNYYHTPPNVNFTIFAAAMLPSDEYPFIGRIYSLTIYDYDGTNDTKILDLVPCRRRSDNVLGLFDTVHNVFYTNSGTGAFTAGPVVVPNIVYKNIADGMLPKKYDPYLTFWSTNSFIVGCYNSSTSQFIKGWNGTMEYSTNKTNWTTWNGTSGPISSAKASDNKYYLYIRGTGNTYVTAQNANVVWPLYKSDFSALCPNMHIDGSIETLLDYQTVANGNHPAMANSAFYDMFYGMSNLVSIPDLSATTLTENCYNSIFAYCTSLTKLPALPATTLANYCYNYMFQGCTGIKISATQTGEYVNAFRIPSVGVSSTTGVTITNMFIGTGGTFKGTPTINTTYYTSNEVVSSDSGITATKQPANSLIYPGYVGLEYIESTGTQYIDTGLVLNQDYGYDIKFKINGTGYQQNGIWGSIVANSFYMGSFVWYYNSTYSSVLVSYYSNSALNILGNRIYPSKTQWPGRIPYDDGKSFREIVNYNNDKKYYMYYSSVSSVKTNILDRSGTLSSFTAGSTGNAVIFAQNLNGTVGGYTASRIYYLKITNGTSLVRDFLPAKRISDGVIGLFDTVNKTFYTNAGTGSFIAGPVII